jgi:hypothetical protein
MAVKVETATRVVRFPDAEGFARKLLASKAEDQGATLDEAAVAEALTALAPFVVDGRLELRSAAIIAIGRVSAK